MLRAELDWEGRAGLAGAITSALAGWNRLRFEVTEEASPGYDAVRFSYTPALGVFSAVTMANGDVLVPESRLRQAMTVAAAAPASITRLAHGGSSADGRDRAGTLEEELARLLGEPWDCELEPFRCAADGAPVRWLHATG
jgi:hypothetical protein